MTTAPGLVVALGRSVVEQAESYATATSRSLVLVQDADDLRFIDDVDIVVALWSSISSKLLQILFETDRSRIPGIIASSTVDSLTKAVMRVSVNSAPKPGRLRRVDVIPSVPLGYHSLGGRMVCGGKSSVDELRTALSSEANLLVIAAHSDGIDADLSPAVFCPLPLAPEQSWNLTCVKRNWCHRVSSPLGAALLSDVLISPAAVKARLLLMLTCHSVVPNEGAEYNPAPLLERIFVEGQVLCTVAMWGVGFLAPGEISRIARLFESGGSAGAAMRQLLNTDLVREGRGRFALFGDPELTIQTAPRQFESPSHHQTRVTRPRQRSFLESLLDGCRRNDRISTVASTTRFAEVIELYPDGLSKPEVQNATIEVMAAFGTMPIKQWLSHPTKLKATPPFKSECPACGSISMLLQTEGLRSSDTRTVISCPTCGIVRDYTTSVGRLDLYVSEDGKVAFRLNPDGTSWAACLVIEHSKDQPSIVMPMHLANGLVHTWMPAGLRPGTFAVCAMFACARGVSVARELVTVRSDLSILQIPRSELRRL